MWWDFLLFILAAQTAMAVLFCTAGYVFVRWFVPFLQTTERPAQQSKRTQPVPPEPIIVNGNGYVAAWQDLKATIRANPQRQLYRNDVETLIAGIEQEHVGIADEETQLVRAVR